MTTVYNLLQEVEGIGEDRANTLLNHFDHGRAVALAASHGWGEIADLDGFSEDSARSLFDRMLEAEVYQALKTHGAVEAGREAIQEGDDV